MLIKHEPAILDWEITRGDAYNAFIQICDDDDIPVDLTGFTISSTARISFDAPKEFDVPIEYIDLRIGQFLVELNSEFTGNLGKAGRPSTINYDIQLTSPDKQNITFIRGTFNVSGDYTNDKD